MLSLVNLMGILSILQRRGAAAIRSERRGKGSMEELASALAGLLGSAAGGRTEPAALLGALAGEGKGDPLAALLAGLLGEGRGGDRQRADAGP